MTCKFCNQLNELTAVRCINCGRPLEELDSIPGKTKSVTSEKKQQNWWWPPLPDKESAIEAVKPGYYAAFAVAVMTSLFATYSLITHKAILSIDPWAYADAFLFLIIGWRIKRYSRVFAVLGLSLFILEKVMLAQTNGATGAPLAIVLLIMFITGARGVFAYHKFHSQPGLEKENL